MQLLIDIGNTSINWALSGEGVWTSGAPVVHRRDFDAALVGSWQDTSPPAQVGLCNVAGLDAEMAVRRYIGDLWSMDIEVLSVQPGVCGIHSNYAEGELGIDRWCAVIGARSRHAGELAVVDCGSAINIEFLNKNDEYLGGMILPGRQMMFSSLSGGTTMDFSQPRVDQLQAGNSTNMAIAAGVFAAICGGIQQALDSTGPGSSETSQPPRRVILTGGDAAMISPLLKLEHEVITDLVLLGMKEVMNWQG